MKSRTCALLAVLSLPGTGPAASAAEYPTKPIRFLVPTAPGGGLDVIARFIMVPLSETLGKPVVVDNRGGASGAIALETTAHAAADGYTMIIFSSSQIIYAALNKTSYDLFRDFAPVSQISAAPYALVVYPGLPVNSVKELVAYAQANREQVNYGSSGNGTLQHLATELFSSIVGVKLTHIPYKGIGAGFTDMIAGRTQMTMSSLSALAPLIRDKRMRALAVTGAERSAMLPEVPTMIEAGIPGFVVTQWHGTLMPAGTPRPIVERMQREIRNAVQRKDVAQRLSGDGTIPVGSSPDAFSAHMKSEDLTWRKVIRQAGVQGGG